MTESEATFNYTQDYTRVNTHDRPPLADIKTLEDALKFCGDYPEHCPFEIKSVNHCDRRIHSYSEITKECKIKFMDQTTYKIFNSYGESISFIATLTNIQPYIGALSTERRKNGKCKVAFKVKNCWGKSFINIVKLCTEADLTNMQFERTECCIL